MSGQLQLIDTPAESRALTPMQMIERALDSGAPVETLEKLMALQERWEANQGRKAFDDAMSDLRGQIKPIIKRREGHNNKYEGLTDIAAVVDPLLAPLGLSYRWNVAEREGRVYVTCIVTHRDGHREETTLSAPPDKSGSMNAIQGVGSSVTYLQRYTLKAALGLAAGEDNDGNAPSKAEPEYDETEWLTRIEKMQPGDARKVNEAIKADRAKIPDRKFKLIVGAYNARLARLKEMEND